MEAEATDSELSLNFTSYTSLLDVWRLAKTGPEQEEDGFRVSVGCGGDGNF